MERQISCLIAQGMTVSSSPGQMYLTPTFRNGDSHETTIEYEGHCYHPECRRPGRPPVRLENGHGSYAGPRSSSATLHDAQAPCAARNLLSSRRRACCLSGGSRSGESGSGDGPQIARRDGTRQLSDGQPALLSGASRAQKGGMFRLRACALSVAWARDIRSES